MYTVCIYIYVFMWDSKESKGFFVYRSFGISMKTNYRESIDQLERCRCNQRDSGYGHGH